MNIIASFLILIAVVLTVLTCIALIGWWRGADSVLFPGFGLVAAMPAIIVFILILNIAVVVAAALIKPRQDSVTTAKIERKFEYPDDIFDGCGNGTLDLSVAKDPNNWGRNPDDHHLKVCINYNDLDSIHEVFAPGIIKLENYKEGANYQKAIEQNRDILQKFSLKYPMLARIEDMYEDYIFNPEEVKQLREECLKMQTTKPDSAADLALRKLIYACDEALKENSYLMFSGD